MSIEKLEKTLTPNTPEEELDLLKKKVEENKSDLTIVNYLNGLGDNDLRILDSVFNMRGSRLSALNVIEEGDMEEMKKLLAAIVDEPDEKIRKEIFDKIKLP
jgi:hypothetical protein